MSANNIYIDRVWAVVSILSSFLREQLVISPARNIPR